MVAAPSCSNKWPWLLPHLAGDGEESLGLCDLAGAVEAVVTASILIFCPPALPPPRWIPLWSYRWAREVYRSCGGGGRLSLGLRRLPDAGCSGGWVADAWFGDLVAFLVGGGDPELEERGVCPRPMAHNGLVPPSAVAFVAAHKASSCKVLLLLMDGFVGIRLRGGGGGQRSAGSPSGLQGCVCYFLCLEVLFASFQLRCVLASSRECVRGLFCTLL